MTAAGRAVARAFGRTIASLAGRRSRSWPRWPSICEIVGALGWKRPHDKETPVDDRRFDALTKNLGTAHTRRGLTRLLGGLSLGGVLSARTVRDAAAAKLNGGAP